MSRATTPSSEGGDTREATILIVDDEATIRELLKATIKGISVPHRVLEAATSQAALELARAHRPDLVLLDIVLPESDTSGVLICQELCKDTRTKVVIVSGQGAEMIIQACLSAGAIDRIRKPFSVPELREKLEAWLRY